MIGFDLKAFKRFNNAEAKHLQANWI